jgi:hypothetical protein
MWSVIVPRIRTHKAIYSPVGNMRVVASHHSRTISHISFPCHRYVPLKIAVKAPWCHTVPQCIYRAYPVHNFIFFLLRISSIPRTTGEPWTASAHSIASHKIEHSPRFQRARYKTSLIYDGPFPMQGSAPYPGDV